ncbi:MAG: carboxypeptidase-like regulatory domain-containing protein [Bacteroidota bacterium]
MIKLRSADVIIRLMKLLFCQVLLINPVFAGDLQGQKNQSLREINLEVSDLVTVRELFEQIERQSNFSFSYHKNDLSQSLESKVKMSAKKINAYQVLMDISKAEKLKFKRINNTINVIKDKSMTEPLVEEDLYPIRGKVTDENGEELPGATVRLKGTTMGAVTGINGEFQFDIPEGSTTLLITYIGFIAQEISLSNGIDNFEISLKPDLETLDEVIVVGYGQQKKESITGSVAKIETEEITQTKTANLANNLAGRVSGLVINARGGEPGQESMEILIRGKATTGDASPLFVIDGVANRGSFERLNPDDIESISVLKDASAAIYGAQAANGVILVTTKRGTEGKPRFKYNNSFALTQPAKQQELMDATQYLTWVDEVRQREGSPQIFQNVIEDYRNGDNDPNIWANTNWWEVAADRWSPQ